MTSGEGLTLRQAVDWCGAGLTIREASRLRLLAAAETIPETLERRDGSDLLIKNLPSRGQPLTA